MSTLFDLKAHRSTLGTASEKGAGLGLILAKEFVEKNGGRISVESKKDRGTTFRVTIPRAEALAKNEPD